MGFVAGGGQGANQTLVVNLGAASSFRNNFDTGTTQLNFKSIGTQLGAQFGNSWYDRTDLYISLFASTASDPIGDTLVFGDPFRTIYASRSRQTPSSSATAFSIASNTAITTTSSQMVAASGTYSAAAADAFGVAIIPDAANTLDNYTKPSTSNSFNGTIPRTADGSGASETREVALEGSLVGGLHGAIAVAYEESWTEGSGDGLDGRSTEGRSTSDADLSSEG